MHKNIQVDFKSIQIGLHERWSIFASRAETQLDLQFTRWQMQNFQLLMGDRYIDLMKQILHQVEDVVMEF